MLTVAVLGASPKPERVSREAVGLLARFGHKVYPVTPNYPEVGGIVTVPDLRHLPGPVDTITLYIGSKRLPDYVEDILAAKPRRVIFNPGTENPEVIRRLEAAGIQCVEHCTLVMLRSGLF